MQPYLCHQASSVAVIACQQAGDVLRPLEFEHDQAAVGEGLSKGLVLSLQAATGRKTGRTGLVAVDSDTNASASYSGSALPPALRLSCPYPAAQRCSYPAPQCCPYRQARVAAQAQELEAGEASQHGGREGAGEAVVLPVYLQWRGRGCNGWMYFTALEALICSNCRATLQAVRKSRQHPRCDPDQQLLFPAQLACTSCPCWLQMHSRQEEHRSMLGCRWKEEGTTRTPWTWVEGSQQWRIPEFCMRRYGRLMATESTGHIMICGMHMH